MQTADNDNADTVDEQPSRRPISQAAQRALKEAEERRRSAGSVELPKEFGGRGGEDPARFGDWEINGRAIDF